MTERLDSKTIHKMEITESQNCYNEHTKVNLTKQTLVCCLIALKSYLIVMLSKMKPSGILKKWLINMVIFIFSAHNLKILVVGLPKNS